MLEGDREGRADTSSTWRTFPCTQQPQLQGIPFPPLLGRLGLGLEMGRLRWVTCLTKQAWVWGPGAETALSYALGTGESVQLQAKGSISPCSIPRTLKLFFLYCSARGLEEVEIKVRLKKEKKIERKRWF